MSQPEKIGPFRILSTVGRGGMGAVYKAVHEETNRVVALKVLLNSVEEDTELRTRFEAEIETLKRLRHPNIVQLYGFGQENGQLYYAMEFVDGPSLASLQKDGCLFTWEQVVHIGVEVCKALRHAHDRGIIHRDIKPANILLLNNGAIKVSDYGIAHFFGSSRLTNANMVIGTIEFMSPEQAQAGPLTPKSDIYSLGALLYALLTGTPPYMARSLAEVLQRYRTGPPESIRYRRPEVPTVLDLFIMELLRVQPEKRPLDARIIGRRLEAIRIAFSQTPEDNPFKDGIGLKNQNQDEERLSRIESAMPDEPGDFILGGKSFVPDLSESSGMASESCSSRAADRGGFGFSFGNEREFSTDGMTSVDSRQSGFDVSPNTDGTAGRDTSTSGVQASGTTGFELSDGSGDLSSDTPAISGAQTGGSQTGGSQTGGAQTGIAQTGIAQNGGASTDAEPDIGSFGGSNAADTRENDGAGGGTDDFALNTLESGLAGAPSDAFSVPGDMTQPSEAIAQEPGSKPSALDAVTSWTGPQGNVGSTGSRVVGRTNVKSPGGFSIEDTGERRGRRDSTRPPRAPRPHIGKRSKSSERVSAPQGEVSVTGNALETRNSANTSATMTSHFTIVEEHELDRLNPEPEANPYYVSIRIWVFSFILLGVGFLFWYSLRSPSADLLYEQIVGKTESCEADQYLSTLRSEEKHCREFVSLYPNDRRVERILAYLSELDLGNLERRLERQLERKSRDSSSSPVERAYIEAISTLKNDPERGIKKLRAFVNLFSSEEDENAPGTSSAVPKDKTAKDKDTKDKDAKDKDAKDKTAKDKTTKDKDTKDKTAKDKTAKDKDAKDKDTKDKDAKDDEIDTPEIIAERKIMFDRTINGQCVILAKRRLQQASQDFEKTKLAELSLLEGRLEFAHSIEQVDPEHARAIRQAIVDFYGDQTWAAAVVALAKEKLRR